MRPIIGVTFSSDIISGTSENYIRAVEEFGGTPRPLYPGISEDAFADIDGLLLTGGGDIHPDNFGEPYHPSLKYVDEDRDALEIPLCQQAIADDLPVLGICRGIQVMSVAMGGSLYQDIDDEYPEEAVMHSAVKREDSRHEIEINESRLSEIVGKGVDSVNSAHHQAVNAVGEGFVVTARCKEDGIVEAMEDPSKRFVLGVQYHPERMIETLEFCEHRRKLFEAFIAAVSD